MPLNVVQIVSANIIVLLGSVLQGSIGFGLGPFAVPMLVLIDRQFVPGPLILAALLLTSLMFRRERTALDKNGFKWAVSGRLLGTIFGTALLAVLPKEHLTFLFSVMVLSGVALSISGIHLKPSSKNLFGAGALSGFMGTTSAIGGAPMALIYQHGAGDRLRSTLSALFILGTIMAVISLFIIHQFGFTEIILAVSLFPGILIGYALSHRTAKWMDRGLVRPAALITSAGSALVLLVQYAI
jgi:uncharacterized membrane protein YfcA